MLARDVAEKLGWHKPTMLHTHLLMGLVGSGRMDSTQYDENPELSSKISLKMSKSIPESSIIIHDEPEMIRSKVRNAYCPPKKAKTIQSSTWQGKFCCPGPAQLKSTDPRNTVAH